VTGDPDGAGQLPSGVYTRVAWPAFANLSAGAVRTIDYAAAIPLHANVASAANATANLDNNTGALTSDEQPVVNWATVDATNGGIPYAVGSYETATAEDLAIQRR
jgi:hypothetical protein